MGEPSLSCSLLYTLPTLFPPPTKIPIYTHPHIPIDNMTTKQELKTELNRLGQLLASGISGTDYKQTLSEYKRIKTTLKTLESSPSSTVISVKDLPADYATSVSSFIQSIDELELKISEIVGILSSLKSQREFIQTTLTLIEVKSASLDACPNGMRPVEPEILANFVSRYGESEAKKRLAALNLYIPE